MFSEENLLEVHQELARRLAEEQITIEAYFFCPHHPHGSVKEFTSDCECRKPKPGMLQQASIDLGIDLKNSYMVGDNLTDLNAGREVGANGVIVGENAVDCPSWARPATDLLDAARIILADSPGSMNSDPDETGEPARSSPATS
jgi:D-glycero-D-manno-heptose 1,7-bisphosphate phosphatase